MLAPVSAVDLVALLANVSVVATVVFLIVQTRASRDQSSETSVQIALDGLQDLQMVFVDRPHLWPFFRQGEVDVPAELRAQVEAVAELYLTTIENLLGLPPAFVRAHWIQWQANIVHDFRRAPILAEIAHRAPELYSPKLLELLAAAASGKPVRSPGGGALRMRTPGPR
jgi:hypothetical protein